MVSRGVFSTSTVPDEIEKYPPLNKNPAKLLKTFPLCLSRLSDTAQRFLAIEDRFRANTLNPRRNDMNRLIYIVGLVVVVLFIAGYVGLR